MKGKNRPAIRAVGIRLLSLSLTGLLISCAGQRTGNPASEDTSTENRTVTEFPHNSTVTGQNLICDTPTHSTEVIWEEGIPRITFIQKPDTTTLHQVQPAIISNADGGRTYGYKSTDSEASDITVFSRFYLDGTCLIQALDSEDVVTVEVSGETRRAEDVSDLNSTVPVPGASENLEALSEETAETETNELQEASVVENWQDEAGESPQETPIATNPEADDLTMRCSGSIQNGVVFTAYFHHDTGFNRVEFLPSTATEPLVSNLSYSGKNSVGQSLWRGGVSAMANVTLVHLSTYEPQRGDRVSVGYDGRWGQAVCQ
jgi:hypothetical protein